MLLSAPPLLHALCAEAAVDHVDGQRAVLRERADGAAAEVGSRRIAAVVGEGRVHDPQPPTAVEDRAAATAVEQLAGGVAVGQAEPLDRQLRRRLVLAVRCRPPLLGIARVEIQDPMASLAAEGHQPAAVDHDPPAGVAHLRGRAHRDRDRGGATGEADHAACPYGRDHSRGGAAGRGPVADDLVGACAAPAARQGQRSHAHR